MSTLRKRATAILAISLALTITPAVAGCSMIEGIIEQQTGGTVDLGGQGLPKNFPTADVPLISGDILFGASIGGTDGTVYNVTIKVSDVNAFDQIKSQLEGAGYTYTDSGLGATTDQYATGLFDGPKYGVLVVVSTGDKDGFVANYTVTAKSE